MYGEKFWRNLIAVGAKPIAPANCLNFGNPEKEKIMENEFVEGTLGEQAEASTSLDFPVVSGNVSFYNETKDKGIKSHAYNWWCWTIITKDAEQ